MSRFRGSIVKRSRREGYALHPKAHKVLARRSGIPGQHAQARRQKPSQYSIQLREKQKVRFLYGLSEKQFARTMKESSKSEGNSGAKLLELLERRLDNAVYRAGFAVSRQAARQIVNHGHVNVNGKKCDIPSRLIKAGDEITIRDKSKKNSYFDSLNEITKHAEKLNLSWMTADDKKMHIKISGLPQREEAEPDIDENLIVEYYSR